jgi:hypothetical protein
VRNRELPLQLAVEVPIAGTDRACGDRSAIDPGFGVRGYPDLARPFVLRDLGGDVQDAKDPSSPRTTRCTGGDIITNRGLLFFGTESPIRYTHLYTQGLKSGHSPAQMGNTENPTSP